MSKSTKAEKVLEEMHDFYCSKCDISFTEYQDYVDHRKEYH